MPKYRLERHPAQVAWSASGNINLELSPKPYTITRMVLIVRASITTTTATNFNDYWDRLITRLNLTGKGETFFSFDNMRVAYHLSRFGGFGPKRPTVVADSATTLVQHFAYVFHFGVAPWRVNPNTGMLEQNPWDLTGGIPPVQSGNLTLGGSFSAAANILGTNVTIADGDVDCYLFGVQPEAGDLPAAYLPRAIPVWSMESPSLAATSSAFATSHDIPSGHHLHSALVMLTNGTNSPRDDSVLNSFRVYNQLEAREILAFGGQTGAVADYKAAEIISQMELMGWPPTDNVSTAMTALTGTAGVPEITAPADSGLVYLPLYKYALRGHPVYGVDMRQVATGDLKLQYGISDATGVTMDIAYRKYKLNMEHPMNQLPAAA